MSTFQERINSNTPTLVDVYATWCGPCKMMPPVLSEVKQQLGDKVDIIKIDIDKNQAYAQQNGIMSVPTLLIYKNGKIVWKEAGVRPAHVLIQTLQQFID